MSESLDDLLGVDLYLALDARDQAFVGMFSSCSFGAGITLPSGTQLTGTQMESIQRASTSGEVTS